MLGVLEQSFGIARTSALCLVSIFGRRSGVGLRTTSPGFSDGGVSTSESAGVGMTSTCADGASFSGFSDGGVSTSESAGVGMTSTWAEDAFSASVLMAWTLSTGGGCAPWSLVFSSEIAITEQVSDKGFSEATHSDTAKHCCRTIALH